MRPAASEPATTEPSDPVEPSAVILMAGRDEMNIAEFPITLLTDRAPRGVTKVEHKDRVYDTKSGKMITRRLTITAPEEYGLPTSIDDDVILALIQLTKQQNNFARADLTFTRRQVLETLGWADKGRNYERLSTSLDRWTSTYLKYENAWWDHEGRQWTSGGFHIIDSYKIVDSRKAAASGGLARCQIVWGQEFLKSCQAGYLKSLDYDLYLRLNYHPAKRMYRFLDKRFYLKPEWTFELRDFAVEHIGLSRTYRDAGKIKEKLQPGIDELEAVGFLEPLHRDERYQKDGRNWTIRLGRRQGPGSFPALAAGIPANLLPDERPAAAPEPASPLASLLDRGVSEAVAAEIVRGFPAPRIQAQVEAFDWLVQRRDRRLRRSPAGFLVESIRQDFAPPPGFEPTSAREERERTSREADRQSDARRQTRAAGRDRDRQRREAADRYWDALPAPAREQLQAEALRLHPADDFVLTSPLGRNYIRTVVEKVILSRLEAEGLVEPESSAS